MRLFLFSFLMVPVLSGSGGPLTDEGFRIPVPDAPLAFPRDHGSHPEFKIEWWYLTGHLYASDGRRFGYQATFFRRGNKPEARTGEGAFGSSHLYLAHMAFTDPDEEQFYFAQRFARNGWDAGSSVQTLHVHNGQWELKALDEDVSKIHLKASVASDVSWELELVPAKPLVRFGQDGTSRKGEDPEARSYYLSFTSLKTLGTVKIGDEIIRIEGSSWMDHEFASVQLDSRLSGWDWIAIQLEDGWEIKAYLLRDQDGSPSAYSALIWIDPSGQAVYRNREDFEWDKKRVWTSRETDAKYPVFPVITTRHPVDNKLVHLQYEPLLTNQELVFPGTTYWEGAGRILDETGKETGSAYLELVGYAGSIEGLR